jgi:hypothetical protein
MEVRDQLITNTDAREFFQGALQTALQNRKTTVSYETSLYLGNLLTSFINAERLFEQTPDGVMIRPLAWYYQDALEARTRSDRIAALRRLGDISLFISGLFANSLRRSLVNIDYYISMGGNAYARLSDSSHPAPAVGLKPVFTELSRKFIELMDVLSEVGDVTNLGNNHDVLCLYEVWLQSGSRRAAERLKAAGIQVVRTSQSRH